MESFSKSKNDMKNETPNKGKGGRVATYSESLKVQVALEYLDGSYSYSQVGEKYSLSQDTVRWFVTCYKRNQAVMIEESTNQEKSSFTDEDRKALEKRVAMAELKVVVLEKVIAIANKKYNTDLKKKLVRSDCRS
jgi:transposase-like protein